MIGEEILTNPFDPICPYTVTAASVNVKVKFVPAEYVRKRFPLETTKAPLLKSFSKKTKSYNQRIVKMLNERKLFLENSDINEVPLFAKRI